MLPTDKMTETQLREELSKLRQDERAGNLTVEGARRIQAINSALKVFAEIGRPSLL